MIRADIEKFCNIREAHLTDENALSLITGYNESGKSSLVGALEFVLTGSAFGLRGQEIAELVTHGESGMHVRLTIGGMTLNRTVSSGDALKGVAERLAVPTDVLPLLFNSQLCGDGGNKAMRTFLDGVASSKFDALAHFAADPIISECINLARRSGKVTTKQLIQYCESMRALQKDPPMPVMPTVPNPDVGNIAVGQSALDAATAQLAEATTTHRDAELTGRRLLQIVQYQREMDTYEKLKAAATLNDALGHTRAKLERLANINLNTIEAIGKILEDLPALSPVITEAHGHMGKAHGSLAAAVQFAKTYLQANPPPPSAPKLPMLVPEAQDLYDEFKKENLLDAENMRTMCQASKTDADTTLTAMQEATSKVRILRDAVNGLIQNQGAWKAYHAAVPEYESAKAKSQSDWKMWDDASKAIAAAETEHVNKAGDVFGSMVSEFSAYVLQGRKVVINRDTGITLGGTRIDRCSVSTRWRIEVSIMAAIARMLKSPLLIIDAADVLDERNKTKVTDFLLERIVPYFQHVVLTATCRGKLEDEKPSSDPRVTKWTIKDGQLSRLAAAAAG